MIAVDGDIGSIGIYFLWLDLTDYLSVGDIISAFSRNVFESDDKESVCDRNLLVDTSVTLSDALSRTPKFIGV